MDGEGEVDDRMTSVFSGGDIFDDTARVVALMPDKLKDLFGTQGVAGTEKVYHLGKLVSKCSNC